MSGPWRREFDAARDPYTARNALGILPTPAGAPTSAQYITAAADPTLTAERVLTNTATITWDFSTAGQAKASTTGGGGNVSNSGTPTVGQYGKWVTATTIQGVAPATVLSDIGAAPLASPTFTGDPQAPTPATADNDTSIATTAFVKAQGYLTSAAATAAYQPLDGDLTSLAAAAGTNTIYYRSAANTWTPVVVSTGLAFSGGNLTATGSSSAITNIVVQKFTASGTYTPTAGMKYCIIECVGGGGGGGGAAGIAGQYYVGAGGGSGGYSRLRATAATIGASQTITIGAAGSAGAGASNGGAGGTTSVGALCIANGGGGGLFGSSGQVAAPGLGATAGTGDIAAAGAPGMAGIYQNNATSVWIGPCGNGGSSVFGGGAAGISSSVATVTGNNASNYGSGGSGGSVYSSATSANGGLGSAGIVIITEYI